MYKDKDKQREAQRNWVRQKRAKEDPEKNRIRTEGTFTGSTTKGSTKRGLDIKCFEDLPVDVQETIHRQSTTNEGFKKRTAIAISYQHQFPDRYNCSGCCISTSERVVTGKQTFGAGAYHPHGAVCTGVVTGKPGDADYNGICTKEWRQERGR